MKEYKYLFSASWLPCFRAHNSQGASNASKPVHFTTLAEGKSNLGAEKAIIYSGIGKQGGGE